MQALGRGIPVERFAWSAVEFGGDSVQVLAAVDREVGALGEVLPQQAVDASMSSSELMLDDLVLPGGSVSGHCAVDDVDQVSLEDAPGAAGALGELVARHQFSGAGVEPLLDDGCGGEHAVEPAVAAAVKDLLANRAFRSIHELADTAEAALGSVKHATHLFVGFLAGTGLALPEVELSG